MRLWSIHPRLLDTRALVAVWREGLLARAVLLGLTQGYRNHPQLNRFRAAADPIVAIDFYLSEIVAESVSRGYMFDRTKILFGRCSVPVMDVAAGQLDYEWNHLMRKIAVRDPARHDVQRGVAPQASPFFRVVPGPVAEWEKV